MSVAPASTAVTPVRPPPVKEERCPIRWAVPAGVGAVAAGVGVRYLRVIGAVSPRMALPAYVASAGAVAAVAFWLKVHERKQAGYGLAWRIGVHPSVRSAVAHSVRRRCVAALSQ